MSHYVAFTGGRNYEDRGSVAEVLGFLRSFYSSDLRVLHGAAPGLDTLVDDLCKELDIRCKAFPAQWAKYGKGAGHVRNGEMVAYLDMCRRKQHTVQIVAFPGGTGTQDMMTQGEAREIDVDRMAV